MNKYYKIISRYGFDKYHPFIGGFQSFMYFEEPIFLAVTSSPVSSRKRMHSFGFGSKVVEELKSKIFDSPIIKYDCIVRVDISDLFSQQKSLVEFMEDIDFDVLHLECKKFMLGDSDYLPSLLSFDNPLEFTVVKFNKLLFKIAHKQRVSVIDIEKIKSDLVFSTSQTDYWFECLLKYMEK